MTDNLKETQRSYCMSRIKAKNTSPEIRVRHALHQLGYRFRLHTHRLPGTPDIVLARHKVVIFVNGCFWHQHPGCPHSYLPASNTCYWDKKFSRIRERDREAGAQLRLLGWRVLTIWECETKEKLSLVEKLNRIIRPSTM